MASKKNQKAAAPKDYSASPPGVAVEPSVRVYNRWDPFKIVTAEMSADSGNLTQAARICEWLLTDDTIRGCLSARINALLGLTPQFEKSGDRRRSARAVRALEAEEDYLASYPEQELWLMLAWGLLLGIAPMRHQPRFDDNHGGRVLPCPEFWHPVAGLRWDQQKGTWLIQVASETSGSTTEIPIAAGDGTWLLHTPFGKHRPHSLGLWRCLAWWKLLKDWGRSDEGRHIEKGSLLVLTQSSAPGIPGPQLADTPAARDQSAANLYQRGKDSVAALPVGKDLKLVESTGQAYQLYKNAIDQANEAFAIAIRGGNLTTNTKQGSLAAAEVQERTGDFVNLRFDSESLATTLHYQSLTWWAQWNFGDAGLAPWPNYPVAPQRNLKNYADTVQAFCDALTALEDRGFEVNRREAIEEFELQEWLAPGTKPKPVTATAPAEPGAKPAAAPAEPTQQKPATPEQA